LYFSSNKYIDNNNILQRGSNVLVQFITKLIRSTTANVLLVIQGRTFYNVKTSTDRRTASTSFAIQQDCSPKWKDFDQMIDILNCWESYLQKGMNRKAIELFYRVLCTSLKLELVWKDGAPSWNFQNFLQCLFTKPREPEEECTTGSSKLKLSEWMNAWMNEWISILQALDLEPVYFCRHSNDEKRYFKSVEFRNKHMKNCNKK